MRRQRGFTLIELLIVIAIIGIIAAIAIPNLLNAINRGRQKRTMADIRTIGTALEEYQIDFNKYPYPAAGDQKASAFITYLQPTYIKRLPTLDGWNNPIGINIDTQRLDYTIWSMAKDGSATLAAPDVSPLGPTTDFNEDIVFSNGQFVKWPEGMQQ